MCVRSECDPTPGPALPAGVWPNVSLKTRMTLVHSPQCHGYSLEQTPEDDGVCYFLAFTQEPSHAPNELESQDSRPAQRGEIGGLHNKIVARRGGQDPPVMLPLPDLTTWSAACLFLVERGGERIVCSRSSTFGPQSAPQHRIGSLCGGQAVGSQERSLPQAHGST
jgi:hypothetical protein